MDATTETQATKHAPSRKSLPLRSEQRRADGARDLGRSQVLTTGVGLQMPTELTFEDWQRAGLQISRLINSSVWWLGDWLVYGKDHFADRYQRGVRAAGLQYQTLRNYAWVSRRFELSRRRSRLSFQHHAEVASLPVVEQERWLDLAERENWSTKQLRNSIRDAQGEERQNCKEESNIQRLPVPGDRLTQWRRAAEQCGFDFDKWVLVTLDSAARQALAETEPGRAGTEHEEERRARLSVG
ncbi:LmbU family transcriptional regulator [Streptomyces sp. 110]|uniref:LmbU family transcriptional regulator n=1 Tax=Streptomyces endocoffeicus TaxID=2898945 RepID=A0ABS1Q9F5_9ACTN|nr:LmbU family transcriptional regulator [Streptomyces endocoffeicus]MBL1120802.1 LmbU family transcriptional regulator [Streptomyces endocoffeicus]